MPDISSSIYAKYKDQGVLVYGIHPGDDPKHIQDFIRQTGVAFPIVRDETGTLADFAFPQGVGYPYPRDVVIDKDLTVRSIRNSFNVDEMDALVQNLLAQ